MRSNADESSTCLVPLPSSPLRNKRPRRRRSLSGNGLWDLRVLNPLAMMLVALLFLP